MTKAELLTLHVLDWAENRGLLQPEFAEKQYLKILEEVGETARAILKDDRPAMIDGFGDIAVTFIIFNAQLKCNQEFKFHQIVGYYNKINFDDLIRPIYTDWIGSMALYKLQLIAKNYDLILEDCLEVAYNQIKNRKGEIINGTFIKETNEQ